MTPPDNISEEAKAALLALKTIRSCCDTHLSDHMSRELECRFNRITETLQAATTPAEVVTVSELNNMIDPQMPSFRNVGNMLLKKYAGRAIIITADNEKE